MKQEQSFYFGGTNVNVSDAQRTTRQEFIDRFLPHFSLFRDIPSNEREKELGICWDMCQEQAEGEEKIESEELEIPVIEKIEIPIKDGDNSNATEEQMDGDDISRNSNDWSY